MRQQRNVIFFVAIPRRVKKILPPTYKQDEKQIDIII